VVGPEFAERALAQRLERRLREQLRVRDLVGWLLHRGLPQRARCWSLECDDGVRMNTGWACESCDCRVADRRAQRSAVSLEVASEFAMASKSVRRAEVEQRLQQVVQAQAAAESVRHERAARERVQRAAAWAAQRAEWETETAERNARACGKCGEPNASGQCPACAFAERTEVWIREAVDIVVALQADPLDLAGVRALSQRVEADSWAVIEQARQLGPETYVGMRAQELRQLAEALFRQRKRAALRRLSTHALAEAEGESAYRRVMEDRLWKFRTRHEAENAAALARTKAQARVAQELLDEFLADLSRARANMTFPAAVAPWSERLAVLAQADE
jgi:RNA polymerase subunit RPABC4/transcription elongation factor Spt4